MLEGERLALGSVVLSARHTPGHTPEHLSWLVARAQRADEPPHAVREQLLVGEDGRPRTARHLRQQLLFIRRQHDLRIRDPRDRLGELGALRMFGIEEQDPVHCYYSTLNARQNPFR